MPIYKFQCEVCKEIEERYIPMTKTDEPRKCVCGADMKRLMTIPQKAQIKGVV